MILVCLVDCRLFSAVSYLHELTWRGEVW